MLSLSIGKDIEAVASVKRLSPNTIVKVVIETSFLTDIEKTVACEIVKEAEADFVKISARILGRGTTVKDVFLTKWTVGKDGP